MANEQDMSNWTDLLHSSTKLLEQAAPSPQFPPLQIFSLSRTLLLTRWQFSKADDRNLDQLEALSKKLKAKAIRTEAPSQSIAATRLLAREGINTEQLARDLKSFELKTTFEDVFPAEATSVEEYLQQVHEMAMVSAIQEAQKDNVRSFNDYMMRVLEEDWQKERRDFLQSLSRISPSPWTKIVDSSTGRTHHGQLASLAYSPHASSGPSGMEIVPLANKSIVEKKAPACAEVVKNLNREREHGSQFKPATAFKSAYESLGVEVSGGKSVNMQKIWHLVQARALHADDGAPPDAPFKRRVRYAKVAGNGLPASNPVRLRLVFLPVRRVGPQGVRVRGGGRLKTAAAFLSLPCT